MNNIKAIRRNKGMTMTELANIVGVSVPYIYDLENGNRGAKPETLEKIASALGCSVEDLLAVEQEAS